MSKKKNIQASNQNLVSPEDGIMNSLNNSKENGNTTTDFQQKSNSAIQPGMVDTKAKR